MSPGVRLVTMAALVSVLNSLACAQESLSDRIDGFVQAEMQRQQVPGAAIGVVRAGAVIKAQGYGYANLEHQVPVRETTIFQSGSLGKQFTAAAVMLLVQDEKLSLSDPLTTFFPEAPPAWRSITVQHLLTHTSGIPEYDGAATLDYQKDYSEEDLARFAFALTPEFPAGERWNYSNTGYVLLGIIVHKVSGALYGDVLAEGVFTPLGMTTARVISEADLVPNRASGYRLVDGSIKNQEWVSPSLNSTADGALYFSLRDLIAWDAAIRARAVLQPQSWDDILSPVRLRSGNTYPYGFGWALDERSGQPLHWHSGRWQGFAAQFMRFVGEDVSVIVLTNLAQANPGRIGDGIAEIVSPTLATPVLRPIEDQDPQITARLARLLDDARAGTLVPGDFPYMNAGFFPTGATRLEERLRALGPVQRMELVSNVQVGDDRVFTYEVVFGGGTMYYRVTLAPNGTPAALQLIEK